MNPIPSLIEEMAKALAFATINRPDLKLRWPEGPHDRIEDRDGSVPFDWDFAVDCRLKAQAIVTHLSTFETFGEDETATELDRAAFDIDCGLTYPSTPMTFALRRAVNGMGSDDSMSAGYQWIDKPHRLVYDACGEIERLTAERKAMATAGEIENLRYVAAMLDAHKDKFPVPEHIDFKSEQLRSLASKLESPA